MELVTRFLDWVCNLLPTSPFVAYIDALEAVPYLSYLNWFVPVSSFIAIGEAWLVSVGLFYMYSIILRWIRAID